MEGEIHFQKASFEVGFIIRVRNSWGTRNRLFLAMNPQRPPLWWGRLRPWKYGTDHVA